DSVDCGTADERPATKAASRARLGRSICADDIEFHHKDAVTIAKYAAQRQAMILVERAQRVVAEMGSRPGCIVVSGQGEFLAKRVVQQLGYPDVPCISVAERLSKPVSLCAPAHALAVLAQLAESAAA
ncbi:MAG: hypothetical protein KDA60_13495, partial [Planctomycetales bacterium]|nr:hypothetical protein [Planctomycetales bacterium]